MTAKIPLFLLPGLLCDAALWNQQVERLNDIADITIPDLTKLDSMKALAQSVLNAAPDRFALAGLSMGGYVAQEIMRQAPDRISHLALLDTNSGADTSEQTERRMLLMELAESGSMGHLVLKMLPDLVHPDHKAKPYIKQTVTDMAKRVDVLGFINQQKAIMGRVDGQADLPKISCKTLILCGAEDQLSSVALHQQMADEIGGNANFVSIAHSGHLSTIEQPEAVAKAMREWLLES